jgi:hypothetical protein
MPGIVVFRRNTLCSVYCPRFYGLCPSLPFARLSWTRRARHGDNC